MKITNFKRNCLGTGTFDGKFGTMRKAQDFDVYPINLDGLTLFGLLPAVKIQSDTRIGWVVLKSGGVYMSPSISSGAHNQHLQQAKLVDHLDAEELFNFKARIMATASGKAGNNGVVYTDNSGALEVFAEH